MKFSAVLRRRFLLSFALALLALSCKPLKEGANLSEFGGQNSSVKVGGDFLAELVDDVSKGMSTAVSIKNSDDDFLNENKRALSKDVASLSSTLSDLVLWFDELKNKSQAGDYPEIYKEINSNEFDRVQGQLAVAQQSIDPMLQPAFWRSLDGGKIEELRSRLSDCAVALTDALAAARRWNSSSTKWLSKSYGVVKDIETRLVQQDVSGRYPTDEELRKAFEEDKKTKSMMSFQMLQSTSKQMPVPYRGQKIIELLSQVDELKELFAQPSGTGECYTILEHTRRVIGNWFDQIEVYGYPTETPPLPAHLMALTVALHDIGKPVDVQRKAEVTGTPYRCGQPTKGAYDSSGQHSHNAIIVRAALSALGASEQAQAIGYQLHGHDTLGDLAKGDITQDQAYADIVAAAEAAGLSAEYFFYILKPFYYSDAGAYPGIFNTSVRMVGPKQLANSAVEKLGARITWERKEAERREAERVAAEKAKAAKAEADRIAAEKAKAKAEADRIAAEKAKAKAEADAAEVKARLEAAEAQAKAKAEADKVSAEQAAAVEAVKKAAAQQKPTSEVSTVTPTPSGQGAVAATGQGASPAPAAAAAPALNLTFKDFCCRKYLVADDTGEFIRVDSMSSSTSGAGLYSDAKKNQAPVLLTFQQGQFCFRHETWKKPACLTATSATSLNYKETQQWRVAVGQ